MVLEGKTILITRAAHQTDEFVRLIKQHCGTPILFPTIEILPPESWDMCDRAIDTLYMYDGVIFTSSNGVGGFFGRLRMREGSKDIIEGKMMFAVGDKTKQAIEQYGLTVTAMPEKFTAFDLTKKIQQEDLADKTFLFPRGNLGKDILADNLKILGANVDSVVVYQTVNPKKEDIEEVQKMLIGNKIDVLTFTSPSAFKNFVELFSHHELRNTLEKATISVIGPTTEAAVDELGFTATIVAKQSTIESLVQAIIEFFQQ